ncbi:GNAT family N-acetyltransferase [Catellatospora paridis]|uniref:GNAT family N-acetyltransferase n=1 Tax=Catellatospora paridis TaxID=1617086 RepID=UPI001E443F0C|nr:GNAT family N-acetyltransferase [Catellatospora paridis]
MQQEGGTVGAERGDLPGLIAGWVHGWAVSRAAPVPVAVPQGWRIDVGVPGHRLRYVLHTPDDQSLSRLGERQNAPGTWIKVAADPAYLRAALPPPWAMADTGFLMTTTLTGDADKPPAPYTIRTTITDVVVVTVLDATGTPVASGRLAPAGVIGVIDQVETAPAHRRRGLGKTVMRLLGHHAVQLGVHTGALVATDDGRKLYGTLGWTVRTPIAAAHVPEPEPEPTLT